MLPSTHHPVWCPYYCCGPLISNVFGYTKVCQFDLPSSFIGQDIVRLDVSVEYVIFVHVVQTLQHLKSTKNMKYGVPI